MSSVLRKGSFLALGLLSAVSFLSTSAHASGLVNGDFETGDFTGWTCAAGPCSALSGDPNYLSVSNSFPNSGSYSAHLGAGFGNTDSLAQLLDTVAGQAYLVTFSYGEYNSNSPTCGTANGGCYLDPQNITNDPANPYYQTNGLTLTWNGGNVFADSNFFTSDRGLTNQGQGFYLTGSALVTGTGGFDTLAFTGFDNQQDLVLDNVNVSAVPEPGTMTLFGSALTVLSVIVRRRVAKK